FLFFFSSRRRHTRSKRDWSSDVCSSDLKFTVTAFAPCRWYAFDMVNANFTGRWEGLFAPDEGGTRIEFTEEVTPHNPLLRLAAEIGRASCRDRGAMAAVGGG